LYRKPQSRGKSVMRNFISFIFFLLLQSAHSQGIVDRIELGYQTSRRGIVWVRPGLPTHEPAWRISRDTNSIMWHNLTTGIRYDWSYDAGVWYTRDFIASTLPPLDVFTSGAATIDNTQATWINDDGVLHHYSQLEGAWLPDKMSFQSDEPADIPSDVGNGAAIYTTSLWQDSDDYLVYYYDGDSWELFTGGATDLTYTGTSSPVTLNSSTGTDVTVTAGTGVTLSASSTNLTITNSAPDQTVSITNGGGVAVTGTYPNFTLTATDQSATNEIQTISASGAGPTSYNIDLSLSGGSVTLSEGTGIDLTRSGNTITAAVTAAGLSKWTDAGAYTYLTATTDRVLIGASSEVNSSYLFQAAGSGILNGSFLLNNQSSNKMLVGVSSANTAYPGIWFGDPTTAGLSNYALLGDVPSSVTILNAPSGGRVDFRINNSEIARLAANGIAIGTGSNPTEKLEIAGNSITSGNITVGGNGIFNNANANKINIGSASGFGSFPGIWFGSIIPSITNYSFLADVPGNGTIFNAASGGYIAGRIANSDITRTTSSGFSIGNTSPQRTLHVTGEARITDLTTDPPTQIVGADADGDLGALALSGLSISSGTLTATDASVTNEAQTLSVSGTTSGIISLNAISGIGGGTATIAAGTGIGVAQSGGTITITNSSPATAGWLIDGNTIAATRRIGSNDNFDVVVETNNTDRMWFDNAGTVSIGATQLTTAALNINGLQTGTGMLIAGGGSLVGPNFYTATGSGTGSTATVLSGVLSMISGNVEALLKNTATTGTGGGSVITLNVSPTATSNDPFIKWQTEATTDWSMGIDNDDIDNLKLHRFSRPSDNNGQGTVEFGYRTNDIGIAVNKTGIGTGTNGFYGIDVGGKVRADQFANNSSVLNGATVATIALGNAAGTSPTLDNTTTSVWGNGARLRFTSGSSPTANGVICTITLDTQYTFGECASGIFARSTNASGFGYSSSFNSATRVITFTLNGTLTASTVYEFNIIFNGEN